MASDKCSSITWRTCWRSTSISTRRIWRRVGVLFQTKVRLGSWGRSGSPRPHILSAIGCRAGPSAGRAWLRERERERDMVKRRRQPTEPCNRGRRETENETHHFQQQEKAQTSSSIKNQKLVFIKRRGANQLSDTLVFSLGFSTRIQFRSSVFQLYPTGFTRMRSPFSDGGRSSSMMGGIWSRSCSWSARCQRCHEGSEVLGWWWMVVG